MLAKSLEKDESLAGRTVKLTITATGRVADAYDMYIDIYASRKKKVQEEETISVDHQIFVRLIFWETTHKQILIGSVSVLDADGMPDGLVECIERTSVPIEKKDYWKKMYEKALVVEIAQCLGRQAGLLWLNNKWSKLHAETHGPEFDPHIDQVSVHSLPIASYESIKRNMRIRKDGTVEVLHPESCCPAEEHSHKCYEGPHGFVRSDSADGFELKLTSMPVSMEVK